jgi:hypothetical protein
VLDALAGEEDNYRINKDALAKQRMEGCAPERDDFLAPIEQPHRDWVEDQVTEKSDWFRATIWVSIGTSEFTLYSLLHRTSAGPVRPILRSIGTE